MQRAGYLRLQYSEAICVAKAYKLLYREKGLKNQYG